jgi:hypothetical protein
MPLIVLRLLRSVASLLLLSIVLHVLLRGLFRPYVRRAQDKKRETQLIPAMLLLSVNPISPCVQGVRAR